MPRSRRMPSPIRTTPPADDLMRRRGRPPLARPTETMKLRIDADVLDRFRETGPGWQTRLNEALRKAVRVQLVGRRAAAIVTAAPRTRVAEVGGNGHPATDSATSSSVCPARQGQAGLPQHRRRHRLVAQQEAGQFMPHRLPPRSRRTCSRMPRRMRKRRAVRPPCRLKTARGLAHATPVAVTAGRTK